MSFSIENIAAMLDGRQLAESIPDCDGVISAAVAMILRQGKIGPELLFIQRSQNENDPWSGHIAFPGGKIKRGEAPRVAAERETDEEIGLDLGKGRYLGQLPTAHGSYLPVQVSCFVYWINGAPAALKLNGEVRDTCWAGLDELLDHERHLIAPVSFGGREFRAPAIRLPWSDSPVVWGLTYRLVMHFLEMCQRGVVESAVAFSPGVGKL